MLTPENVIQQNKERLKELHTPYDPILGLGSPIERAELCFSCNGDEFRFFIPLSMTNHPLVVLLANLKSIEAAIVAVGGKPTRANVIDILTHFTQLRFDHDFEFWAISCAKIQDKESKRMIPLKANRPQRKVLGRLEKMRLDGIPIRAILLKARQWGGSTLVQIYMSWLQNRIELGWHSAIITDVEDQARNIRNMYTKMAANYPAIAGSITLKPYAGSTKSKEVAERGCIINLGSVQKPESLRSFDFAMLHLCLAPNTRIPTKDGFLKKAEDISIGDEVITHNGNVTYVSNFTISPPRELNGNGKSVIIRPWHGLDTELTPNHPVFTNEGWVRADMVTTDHLLSMPIRPINHTITHITLPFVAQRKQGGGKVPTSNGATIPLTADLGYFFGYYLAQGSLNYGKTNNPTQITLTRHDDHAIFSDRAVKAAKGLVSSTTREKRPNTLTTMEHLYGSILASYIESTFGTRENKRIPDWVFDCGRDFIEALLAGYLCGDGSKTNGTQNKIVLASVSATTVSSSLAMQFRDIVASLGIGWGSLHRRDKGIYYGRNCKETFVVYYNGIAARRLRALMGLSVPDNGQSRSEKYHIEGNHVWFKIKEIKHGTIDRVVDIEVKHPDHSFRTAHFSVKNSEVGLWKDTPMRKAEDLAQSLQSTVPESKNTLVVLESTAKGVGNFFHRQWLNAEDGKSVYDPIFVAWWEIERYQKPILPMHVKRFIASWGEYEWFLWNLGATIEGIHWYKSTKDGYGYDDWRMMSEFPSTAREAFQSSGRRAFAAQYVQNAYATCIEPLYKGDVYGNSQTGEASLKNIEFKEDPAGRLFIWELPDNGEIVEDRYAVFADIGGRTEGADFSICKVIDRYWMMDGGVPVVVAVWCGHLDQDIFAWKCAQIAKLYNNAKLAVETNSLRTEKSEGDHFLTVLDEIAPHYNNLYIRENVDNVRYQAPAKYGFHTNMSTKPMIIDTLNAALRDNGYVERDRRACVEMDYYEIKPNGSYGAVDGQHDDHVITTAGLVWLSYKMPKPRIRAKRNGAARARIKRTVSEATI